MGLTVLEVVLGAVIAIATTILVEGYRRPKLEIVIDTPVDAKYPNHPAKQARYLNLRLRNKAPDRWMRWISRNPAMQCHGTITFRHSDGRDVFDEKMPIRWCSTPEPVPMKGKCEDRRIVLFDPVRLTLVSNVDVYPGESEAFTVAARFDDDVDCYGWSNESYFSNPMWRNPRWELPQGYYIIEVVIVSAGDKCVRKFRLIHDATQGGFRIETAASEDTVCN